MNSRHPDSRRVWMGGSELRRATSLPLAAAGCGWLPLAAAGVFRDPQLLATLPSISLKNGVHGPSKIVFFEESSRFFWKKHFFSGKKAPAGALKTSADFYSTEKITFLHTYSSFFIEKRFFSGKKKPLRGR